MRRRRSPSLETVLDRIGPPTARVEPAAPTLSARAAQLLANGPLDPHALMRQVCRLERVRADAAARMAEVLLGTRPEFVQLDDDRWALVHDGRIVQGEPVGRRVEGEPPRGELSSEVPLADGGEPAPAAGPHTPPSDESFAQLARTRPSDESDTLRAHTFAVVDVETTGSQPGLWDRVTEIAIVPVRGGRVGDPWSSLVHPGRAIPPMISALTGITDAMVAQAPRFGEIADDVVRRLDGTIFTAHNAAFDRRFVDAELTRARGVTLAGASLCTVRLTRRLVPSLSRRSLDRVTSYFGIRISDRHRAAGDAIATAEVLVRLLEIAAERDVSTWCALERLLGSPARRRPVRRRALPTSVSDVPDSEDDVS